MASSIAHDFFRQEANTLHLLCVLIIKGVTSLGPHLRPACHQAPLEIVIKKNDFFHDQTYVRMFFSPCLGPRVTWCNSCPLIGRERSREEFDDVSYANESRDLSNNTPIVFAALWLVTDWRGHV